MQVTDDLFILVKMLVLDGEYPTYIKSTLEVYVNQLKYKLHSAITAHHVVCINGLNHTCVWLVIHYLLAILRKFECVSAYNEINQVMFLLWCEQDMILQKQLIEAIWYFTPSKNQIRINDYH